MALGPIDYSSAYGQADFGRDIQSGLQAGQMFQQRRLEIEKKQAAAQAAQQYQTDIGEVMKNPSAQAMAGLALKYPQQREAYKQAWEQMDAGQQKAQGEAAMQTAFALESGNPEAAKKVLQDRITAMGNAGQDASHEKLILGSIDSNPNAVRTELLRWAAFTQDPAKFAENFGKLDENARKQALAPAELDKAKADAGKAGSEAVIKAEEAKYAPQTALLDYQKKGWDIKKVQADIVSQRETNRIAAMNAAYNRDGNDLKREELKLKIGDAVRERDEKVRGKIADVESAAGNIDNMLNTIARIEKNPSLNAVLGSLEGKPLYPNALLGTATAWGDGDERSDAIKLIETLGSQAFLAQIPNIKGMGALSNAEGEKLQSAFQNLSREQSEKQFRATLKEATRLLNKGRETVGKRYGVPMGAPDTPASPQPQAPAVPQGWTVQVR